MATELPSGRVQPRFAGLATFMRFPRLSDASGTHDWIVYGIPFDGGTTFHPGARFGPRAVREASQYVKPASIELQVDVAKVFSLADAGDAPVAPFSCADNLDMVTDFAKALGGDHSVSLANIRAAWEHCGRPASGLALVVLDAHVDSVDRVWDEPFSHASVLRRAVEDGCIDPTRTLLIGQRGGLNTLDDLVFARDSGMTTIPAAAFHADAADAAEQVQAFRRRIADAPLYLSCDVDCADPAFAPGTGTPVCGGLSSGDLLAQVRAFAGAQLVGADVVEVCPARDVAGITALLAAHVAFECIAIDAVGRTA